MDFIKELQDLRYLDWTDTKMSPGPPGCFLKAYEEKDGERYYYKLSNYDSYRGVFGHECVNELIVSRLLDILKVEHLQYQLIHARISVDGQETETYINRSANFRKGKREIDTQWSLRWVQERVTPPERQNIGQVLKNNGMQCKLRGYSIILKTY